MNIKARAVHAEDKQERRCAILDAAERLLLAHPQRIASVDEVAAAAGLAKGTVYLYFPSKEELLLAIHDRNSDRFFDALIAVLNEKKSVDFDAMFVVVRQHMIETPGFLPLAALCFGLMEKSVPVEAAAAHKLLVATRLQSTSVALERRFPGLGEGQGIALLMHSYALIVGLWQMIHPSPLGESLRQCPGTDIFRLDYATELESALRKLWAGHLMGATDGSTRLRAGKKASSRTATSRRKP